jgi:predicted membrane channel-forming protein YqfA (hemolysin III family)
MIFFPNMPLNTRRTILRWLLGISWSMTVAIYLWNLHYPGTGYTLSIITSIGIGISALISLRDVRKLERAALEATSTPKQQGGPQ